MTLSLSNDLLAARFATRDRDDEADDERPQIEAAVEPIGEACEVVGGIFSVVECVVGTGQGRLQIAQDSVDPSEFGQVSWLALADHGRQMHATGPPVPI
jgi:hypothetical protein